MRNIINDNVRCNQVNDRMFMNNTLLHCPPFTEDSVPDYVQNYQACSAHDGDSGEGLQLADGVEVAG